MWVYKYSDALTHYGVKGQKWGVKRNKHMDGSLFDAVKHVHDRASNSDQPSESKTTKTNEHKLTDYFDFSEKVDRPFLRIRKLYNETANSDLVISKAHTGAKWLANHKTK